MVKYMSKSRKTLFLIALLLTNIAVMGDNLLYPITANIYGEFYENIGITNYVVSGPLIIIFLVSLIAPKLLEKMSQKTMLIIGGVIFAVSTIFGVIVPSIVYMAVMRTFTGVGQALINVAAMSLIAAAYDDEQEVGAAMGLYNSFMPVIGVIFGLVSGVLAVGGWRRAYYGYLSSILMVIMIILFIPSTKPENPMKEDKKADSKTGKRPLPAFFWVSIIVFLLIVISFNMMAFYVSFYVSEHALGNESMAGMMSTMISVGSMIFCFLYAKIYEKLKYHTMTLAIVGLSAALFLLYFLPSLPVTVISLILVGGTYGLALTFCYAIGAEIAPPEQVDAAIGYVTATYAIGGFVSTYISTWLMDILQTNGTITPTLIVPALIMIPALVIHLIFSKKNKIIH